MDEWNDDKKERKTLGHWFRNVFLYHYLKPAIAIIAVLIVVAIFIRDAVNAKEPDFTVVVGSIDILLEEDMAEVMSIIADEVGDANGDGEVYVHLDIYTPTLDPSDEYGQQNLEALDMAFIADPGRIFFIFDDQLKIRYETDYFERLSDHGIESEEDPFYMVNDLPVFKRIFVIDTPYYMCLKGWLESEKNDPKFIRNYDMAVRVMRRLINEK